MDRHRDRPERPGTLSPDLTVARRVEEHCARMSSLLDHLDECRRSMPLDGDGRGGVPQVVLELMGLLRRTDATLGTLATRLDRPRRPAAPVDSPPVRLHWPGELRSPGLPPGAT